jgi:hypothetical protein
MGAHSPLRGKATPHPRERPTADADSPGRRPDRDAASGSAIPSAPRAGPATPSAPRAGPATPSAPRASFTFGRRARVRFSEPAAGAAAASPAAGPLATDSAAAGPPAAGPPAAGPPAASPAAASRAKNAVPSEPTRGRRRSWPTTRWAARRNRATHARPPSTILPIARRGGKVETVAHVKREAPVRRGCS